MMEPVKKTRLYEDIVQQFIKKIECGELKPGERLPTERELVDQMGVSRTSIREALRAMELIGIVESKVGEGTYIKHLSMNRAFENIAHIVPKEDKFILEMYDVRMLLETYSAKLAAKNRTEEQLAQLQHAIDLLKIEIDRGDNGLDADRLFHDTMAKASGNSALCSVLSMCSELMSSSIENANAYVNVMDIISEHQAMYEAIKKQDGKEAEKLIRSHIKRAYDRTKFLMSKTT